VSNYPDMPQQYVTPVREIKKLVKTNNITRITLCGTKETTLAPDFETTWLELLKLTRHGGITSNFTTQTTDWWRRLFKRSPLNSTIEITYAWHVESSNLEFGLELEKILEDVNKVRPDINFVVWKNMILSDIGVDVYRKAVKQYPDFLSSLTIANDSFDSFEVYVEKLKAFVKEFPNATKFSYAIRNQQTEVCSTMTWSHTVQMAGTGGHWVHTVSGDVDTEPKVEWFCEAIPYNGT
jgi:hypothetical protein